MTPPTSRNPKSDGNATVAEVRVLEKLTEEMGQLVNSVKDLTEGVLRESEQARELAREDRETFYRLMSEANAQAREAAAAEAELRSQEALAVFRERRPDTPRLPVITSVADQFDAGERLKQRELVLTYDAWRTMLGRPGAASVFQAERGYSEEGEPVLHINAGPFDEVGRGWTLVVTLDNGKTLRADLPEGGRGRVRVALPRLDPEGQIRRLEIVDERGYPLYLGLGAALQTQQGKPARELVQGLRADDEDR